MIHDSLGLDWGPFVPLQIVVVHEETFPEEDLVPGRSWMRNLPDTNALRE